MANQFYETKTMFENYTGCTANVRLPYEAWMKLHNPGKDGTDKNSKAAAALFVMFFDEITLAWSKASADFIQDEDGIECVLQYLQKNVDKIRENRARYTPSYIYRVAYNCMDCLRYVEREQFRSKLTSSNVVPRGEDDPLDLYDTSPDTFDYDLEFSRRDFWAEIEKLGDETAKVVNHLLNGDSLYKVSARAANRDDDPLRDVSVSKAQKEEIMERLRTVLAPYKSVFLGSPEELEAASKDDVAPLNLRKQPKLVDQVKAYLESRGELHLGDAERLFLLTRKPLNTMMHSLKDSGFPVAAHYVDVIDSVAPANPIEMIDYYYLVK